MSSYTRVRTVHVGANVAAFAKDQTLGLLSAAPAGTIAVFNEEGVSVTDVATNISKITQVMIGQSLGGGNVRLSSPIQINTVSNFMSAPYKAPTEQVTFVGFDGTSGDLPAKASTDYRLRIHIKDSLRTHGQRPTLIDANYPADVAATQFKIANYIAKVFDIKDLGHNYAEDKVLLERVCDGTIGASLALAYTTTNGSKSVTATAHTCAVGDVIKFGGASAPTNSTPYYVVASVKDANTIVLDVAYKGATLVHGAANTRKVTAIGKCGFKLTALSQKAFIGEGTNSPVDQYTYLAFEAGFGDVSYNADPSDYAVVNKAVKAYGGNGFWKQVAQDEESAKGYLGDTDNINWYADRINSNVVVGEQYKVITIDSFDIHPGSLQDTMSSPIKTTIYLPATSANNANVIQALNTVFATVGGMPVIS